MKFNFIPVSGKKVWQDNKPFIWLVLSLLLIYSILKIIFYQYNHQLIFHSAGAEVATNATTTLIKWSLGQDLLTITGINVFLLVSLTIARMFSQKFCAWFLIPVFVLVNSFAIILNLADIFYFRFHFQRASADLWYVIDHPLDRLIHQGIWSLLLFITGVALVIALVWIIHRRFWRSFSGAGAPRLLLILLSCGAIMMMSLDEIYNKLLPTYPMVELQSKQLPFVQNSFHTFCYSVYRRGETAPIKNYMTDGECDSLMPIRKKLSTRDTGKPQNIVLFIMESVPYDFFDSSSRYKVSMPFFDSLLTRSTFFNNAFCYAHESNKGITAILAGIPTISDIPVYHSQYVNLPFTGVGTALKKLSYQSLFCIGDEYDNFGFAKCMNWLGIGQYYSKEDIPGYKTLPAHSMGLQDEPVLDFFRKKIGQQQGPFFAVHYNISTHYPYDIPANFATTLPAGYTAPMKAMRYYDNSLLQFFDAAKNESWYSNTTFIFVSDHWLFPEGKKGKYTDLTAYRIPIVIFDPAQPAMKNVQQPVSQFDILGTVLSAAGYRGSLISFGDNLLDSLPANRWVFTKAGANLYQVIDSAHILGFNVSTEEEEFLYNYRQDKDLRRNLVKDPAASANLQFLSRKLKAFLQKTKMQQYSKPFK